METVKNSEATESACVCCHGSRGGISRDLARVVFFVTSEEKAPWVGIIVDDIRCFDKQGVPSGAGDTFYLEPLLAHFNKLFVIYSLNLKVDKT